MPCALVLLVLVAAATAARAGGEVLERSPRSSAMGDAGAALHGAFGILNPSLLRGGSGGALSWTPRRFGFSELLGAAVHGKQEFSGLTAAAGVQHFGFEAYSEQRITLAAAVDAGEGAAFGLRGFVTGAHMQRYGSAWTLGLDAGVCAALTPDFRVGAAVLNLTQSAFLDGERQPVQLQTGLSWRAGTFTAAMDAQKSDRHPLTVRWGMELILEDVVALRCGAVHTPMMWTAGTGLLAGRLRFDYAVAVHPDLGWTHSLGIGFQP